MGSGRQEVSLHRQAKVLPGIATRIATRLRARNDNLNLMTLLYRGVRQPCFMTATNWRITNQPLIFT